MGNRTQVVDSAGGTTDSRFDALNRLTYRSETESSTIQLSVTQVYDAVGRLSELDQYGTSSSLIAKSSYTYDADGRLTKLLQQDATPTTLANYTYVYDAHSRLTSEIDNGTTTTYTYDDTDQVTADGATTVTYDANGNRNNGSYTNAAGNRLTSDGTWTYTYNAEGDLVKKSKGASAETWAYVYDEKNELTQVTHSATDGGAIDKEDDFKYDVYGNRIEQSYDADGAGAGTATITRFAYDGWKNTNQHLVGNEAWDVWADLNGASSLTTRYIRGDAIDQVFARIDSGTKYWYLGDHLGSIRDVLDSGSAIKDGISYDAFGNIATETNSTFRGRYAWTGREINGEINLQYNRARYYDTATGRWISQDQLGFDAGDSNLYRYTRNALLKATDPSGELQVIGTPSYRTSGNVKALDKSFTLPIYEPLVSAVVGQTNLNQLRLGNTQMFQYEVPESIGLLKGSNPQPVQVNGKMINKNCFLAAHHIIFLEWEVKNPDALFNVIAQEKGNRWFDDEPKKTFVTNRNYPSGVTPVRVGQYKAAQPNGATHRVIVVDAPGLRLVKSDQNVGVRQQFAQDSYLAEFPGSKSSAKFAGSGLSGYFNMRLDNNGAISFQLPGLTVNSQIQFN